MKTYSPVMDEYFRIALETGLIKEATPSIGSLPLPGSQKGKEETVTVMPETPISAKVPSEDVFSRSDRSRGSENKPTYNDRDSRKTLEDRPGLSKSNKNDTMAQIVVWFLSKEMLGISLPTEFIDGVWGDHSREALNKLIRFGKLDLAVGEKLDPTTVQKFYNENKGKINSALASAGAEKTLAKLNIPAGKSLAADDSSTLAVPSSISGQDTVGKFSKDQISAFMGIYNDPRFKGKDFPFIMEEATEKFPSLFPPSKYKVMDFTETKNISQNAGDNLNKMAEDRSSWVERKINNKIYWQNPETKMLFDPESSKYFQDYNGKLFEQNPNQQVKQVKSQFDQWIKDLQNQLNWKFGQKLNTDGVWGPKTKTALELFSKKYGLDMDFSEKPNTKMIVWLTQYMGKIPQGAPQTQASNIGGATKPVSVSPPAANDGEMNEKMKENMWQGATLSEASMNKTSNHVVNELISLANDLDKMGEVKAAIAVDNQLSLYKTAMDKLYDITGETGEQLLNSAHPEGSVTLAPAQNEGGVVETAVDQQKKNIAVVSKDPTGKYASTIKSLIATANRLESEGNIVGAEKVDRAINELLKKNPFRHNGVAKAASTSIGKKYAAEEYMAEQIRKDLLELKKYLSAFVASIYNVKTIDDATSMSFNEFGNRLLEWSKWTDLVERKKDLLGTLLKEKVKFVDDKKITNAFGANDQDAKSKYEAFQNIFNSIVKKIKNDPYYQFSTQGQKTDAQQSQEPAPSVAESSQGQKSSGQPQADGGTKKGRVYEAYLLRMKNLVGSLKRARGVIDEHKDDVSKLMGIDDIKIAEELDSLDKEINTWEQKIKNNEITLANATAANERNAKVFPIVQKLEGKFGKSASNKFSISKRAADFLTDLDSKLGPATPAKPSEGGRGGAGKGGSGQYNKSVDSALATQIQTLLNEIREMRKEPAQIKVDGRFGPRTNKELYQVTQAFLTTYPDIGTTPTISYEQATNASLQPVVKTLENIKAKISAGAKVDVPGTTPGAPGAVPGQPGVAAGGKGKTTVDRRSDFLIKMERLERELPRYQNRTSYPERFNHFGDLKQAAMAKDLIERETLKTTLRSILESAVGQELDQGDITHYEYILNSYDEALAKRASENFNTDMSGVRRLYFSENSAKARQSLEVPSASAVSPTQEQQAPAQPAAQGTPVGQEPVQMAAKEPNKKEDDYRLAMSQLTQLRKDMGGEFTSKSISEYIKSKNWTKEQFKAWVDQTITTIYDKVPARGEMEKKLDALQRRINTETDKI